MYIGLLTINLFVRICRRPMYLKLNMDLMSIVYLTPTFLYVDERGTQTTSAKRFCRRIACIILVSSISSIYMKTPKFHQIQAFFACKRLGRSKRFQD